MIAKLIAWGGSRADAIARMSRALEEYQVLGIRTTIPFFAWLMRQPAYRDGQYDTTWLDRLMAERRGESFNELDAADDAARDDRRGDRRVSSRAGRGARD